MPKVTKAKLFAGPFLPRDQISAVSLVDSRVKRAANFLYGELSDMLKDPKRIGICQSLMSLPSNIYVCDLLIYPSAAASLLRYDSIQMSVSYLMCSSE